MVSKYLLTDKMKKILILVGGALLIAGLVFFAVNKLEEFQKVPEREYAGVPVETMRLSRGDIKKTIEYSGTVQAEKQAELAPKIMCRIESIKGSEGEKVSRGETLVTLDDSEFLKKENKLKKRLEKAKVDLKHWEKEVETYKPLVEQGAVSRHEFENMKCKKAKAEAAVEEVQAALEEVEESLNNTVLRSPINGVITACNMEEGEMSAPGKPVLKIAGLDSLKIVVKVIEQDLSELKPGDRAVVTVPGVEGEIITRIKKIYPALSSAERTAPVELEVPSLDEIKLRPGMSAGVSFVLEEKENTLLISTSALREQEGKSFIFIIEDGQAVRKEVTTGIHGRKKVEITGGISAGEKVVLDPPPELYEGRQVYVPKGESSS